MSKNKSDNNVISFRALQISNEHRSAYGLRYNDFNRYRNHCANRTHRLRSTLKMTHGKGREFKKLPPITLDSVKDGHLQLLLFEAERAWSYSQELQANSALPVNSSKASKIRHSATGRFRRSIHWCTQLLSHCQSLYAAKRLSAENLVEATAYTLMMSGRFLRHKDESEDAMEQLCVARTLLDELVGCASNSRDQALATMFADEISPEIRYCAHQLGQANSYDVDAIVKSVAPKNKFILVAGYDDLVRQLKSEGVTHGGDGRKHLRTLMWEGKEVPIRNPELVDVLLQVQAAEDRLQGRDDAPKKEETRGRNSKINRSRKGVAAFDGVLAALSDAEGVARKLIEAHQAGGSTSTATSGTRDIHFVHSFLLYQLLSKRIQRDLALIEALVQAPSHDSTKPRSRPSAIPSAKKAKESDARVNPPVVKLLETVLQSLEHMRSLSIVDESPDLANAVDTRLAHAKCRKCIYLARAYAAVKQYAQALALTRKAALHLRECTTLSTQAFDPINAATPPFYSLTQADVSITSSLCATDEHEFKNEWFQYNGGTLSFERNLAKKPEFLDIAFNYVPLDMDKLQARAGIKAPEPKVFATPTPIKAQEPKPAVVARAKAEEIQRPATPEPTAPARGGLSSLLGGWWGRK